MVMRDEIRQILMNSRGGMTAEEICEKRGFSGRTAVSRELRVLVGQGEVTSLKQGRNVFYSYTKGGVLLDMTVVQLGLYREGSMWISRSQAKRVLSGLECYQRVVFDFAGINMVGQAFCDEVFRVFNIAHPEIKLEAINMNKSVEMMVSWAMHDQLGRVDGGR